MAATNVSVQVESNIKEQAESILSEMDISMSGAFSMFLEQVIAHGGMPFDMQKARKKPLCLDDMTTDEINAELQKGLDDIRAGRVTPAKEVRERMHRLYGI
ncbi:MAG: type II toxin-antitoxin system RelB/DinJ family antitoxin [Ruminococcus sp.]|nr:type II toxin-antitoxin system RelB/DinJ family antitoxin [Ruminococcus sp.]